MDYDENKKIEVEVSENQIFENRIEAPKEAKFKMPRLPKKLSLEALDVAMIPIVVGVFLSLGFLFANIFKVSALTAAATSVVNLISSVI